MSPGSRGRRRGRVFGLVVIVIAGVAAILWPLAAAADDRTEVRYQPFEQLSLTAQYSIDAQGTLNAVETYTGTLQFATAQFSRWWQVDQQGFRYLPTVQSVAQDGQPVRYQAGLQLSGIAYAVVVGSEDPDGDPVIPGGAHTFVISYQVPGVIGPNQQGSQAAIEVVDANWAVLLNRVEVSMQLPAAATNAQCVPGNPDAAPIQCAIEGGGSANVKIDTTVDGNQGLVVETELAMTAPGTQVELAWPAKWDRILGYWPSALIGYAIISALMFAIAWVWPRALRERPTGDPITYQPPSGMSPAQVMYCAHGTVGAHVIAASLTHLEDRRLVSIKAIEGYPLEVHRVADKQNWQSADVVSRAVGEGIGLREAGDEVTFIARQDVAAQYPQVASAAQLAARSWSREAGLSKVGIPQLIGAVVWWLCLPAAAVCASGWLTPTVYVLPFLAFLVGGFSMTAPGFTEIRSQRGRQQWAQALGFEKFLATPASQRRMEYSAREALPHEYLAYALAFGIIGNWQQIFIKRDKPEDQKD